MMDQQQLIDNFQSEMNRIKAENDWFCTIYESRLYFYGFIRSLEMMGLTEGNVKKLRLEVLQTFV